MSDELGASPAIAENTVPEVTTQADAAPPTPETPESAPGGEKPTEPAKDKIQERFDKLTRDKYEALRRADQLEYRLSEMEAKLNAPKEPVAPVKAPTLESVGYDEGKYQAAVIEFARSEARAAALAAYQEQVKAQEAKAKAGEFEKRQAAFVSKHPDYAEKVHANLPISQAMADVIRESDLGPDVAYYLGSNPAQAASIAQLPPHMAARELGRIEAKLEMEKSKPAPVSSAPPPPPKVDAAEASTRIDLGSEDAEKLTDAEWTRRRNLQEQRARENRNRR